MLQACLYTPAVKLSEDTPDVLSLPTTSGNTEGMAENATQGDTVLHIMNLFFGGQNWVHALTK